jgi:N-acetylmuramoyl-L-alanine amidase
MKAAFAEEEVVGWGIRSHPINLRVLEKTRCPAVLVEVGHLSNRYDRALLSQGAYREKLAELLARAILAHLAGAK